MADFKLPDPKKTSGSILGIGVLGVLGLVTYSYILPWLNKIVWGTVELAVGIAAVSFLGYILLSKKFWRRTKIILDGLGEVLFGWFVEMNKWNIMQLQLDKAEKDREEVMEANKRLQGQEVALRTQLQENELLMKQSAEEIKICQGKLKRNPDDEDTALAIESSTVAFNNSKDFIDSITPLHTDIKTLVQQTEKAYRKSGNALKNARMALNIQRKKYDAMQAGQSAMTKALRAFTGDAEMNKAANIAMNKIQQDIANMAGTIRTTIRATSDLMNERDLRDAAKVSLAAKTVEQLNIDDTFEYTTPIEVLTVSSNVPKVGGNSNKYLNDLK